MSGPSEFVGIADREIAARKRRDEAQAILDSLPTVQADNLEPGVQERELRALAGSILDRAFRRKFPSLYLGPKNGSSK